MTATHSPMHDRRPAVVVLRALGLGELLTTLPALRALADAFPRHPRLLAAPAVLAPLARASGAVDEVIGADGLTEPLHRRLHGAGLAVNLHGRGPESSNLLLAAEPRRLVAFSHPAVPASSQGPRWRPDEHEVARWCRLLSESGIAAGTPPCTAAAARASMSGMEAPGARLLHRLAMRAEGPSKASCSALNSSIGATPSVVPAASASAIRCRPFMAISPRSRRATPA